LGAWSLVRVFGWERGFPGVPLIAYTPYALAAAAPILVVCLVLRRWAPAAIATIAAVALAAGILPRMLPGPGPLGDPDGPTLRVMTTNLRVGKGNPETVLGLIRSRGVDVVSFQEFTPEAQRTLEDDGLLKLLPHRYVAPAVAGTDKSAIYSRLPMRPLPAEQNPAAPMPRALLMVAPGVEVDFVGVHPHVPNTGNSVGVWKAGMEAVPGAAHEGPVRIVAGDFNSTLDSSELRRLIDTGYTDAADARGTGLDPTFPALGDKALPVTIDHVLVDRRVGVEDYDLADVPRSDHRTVIVELRLP
jgi:endonuclease/exonuclease/phosphatase (EEP) superfamily protein YafD